jgi:hypothetical protein
MPVSYQETDSTSVACAIATFCSGASLNVGATRSKVASLGGVAGVTSSSPSIDANANRLIAVQFELSPSFATGDIWGVGNYVVRLNITAGNANLTLEDVYVCRVNSACVSQATIGSSLTNAISLSTTGVKTVTVSGAAQAGAAVGDIVQIILTFSNTNAGVQGFTFLPDQLIDTPITPAPPPPMDAGRRWMYYATQVRM